MPLSISISLELIYQMPKLQIKWAKEDYFNPIYTPPSSPHKTHTQCPHPLVITEILPIIISNEFRVHSSRIHKLFLLIFTIYQPNKWLFHYIAMFFLTCHIINGTRMHLLQCSTDKNDCRSCLNLLNSSCGTGALWWLNPKLCIHDCREIILLFISNVHVYAFTLSFGLQVRSAASWSISTEAVQWWWLEDASLDWALLLPPSAILLRLCIFALAFWEVPNFNFVYFWAWSWFFNCELVPSSVPKNKNKT